MERPQRAILWLMRRIILIAIVAVIGLLPVFAEAAPQMCLDVDCDEGHQPDPNQDCRCTPVVFLPYLLITDEKSISDSGITFHEDSSMSFDRLQKFLEDFAGVGSGHIARVKQNITSCGECCSKCGTMWCCTPCYIANIAIDGVVGLRIRQ